MRIGNSFSKLFTYSVIAASSFASCTKKPFVKMPAEKIAENVKKEIAAFKNESQEILKDTTYTLFGKDTLLLTPNFREHFQKQAKKNVKKVVVDKKMVTQMFFTNNRTEYIPVIKYIKEDKYFEPKAVIKNLDVYTTDSTKLYVPVEYYGKLNPKSEIKVR